MDTLIKSFFDSIGFEYRLFLHPAVHRVEESKIIREIQEIPGLHCKTLFLKDELGRFYLAGMPAEERFDFAQAQKVLCVKKLTMGSVNELLKETGLAPGSVSIFGAMSNEKIILILDKKVSEAEFVGFHPNVNYETIVFNHDNLEKYCSALKNKVIIL